MIHILSFVHAQECADLHALCFEKKWSLHEFQDFFDNHLVIILGSWDNNILVGLLTMVIIGNEAEIYTLCTHPNHRGKNIASHLIKTAQQQCHSRLVTDIFLEVSVENMPAIACYNKNNFKITTIRKNYYTENNISTDAFLMHNNIII